LKSGIEVKDGSVVLSHSSSKITNNTMAESVGILGAGITGLATAYVLSSKYKVTIVARDLPGDLGLDWASPWFVIPRLIFICFN